MATFGVPKKWRGRDENGNTIPDHLQPVCPGKQARDLEFEEMSEKRKLRHLADESEHLVKECKIFA